MATKQLVVKLTTNGFGVTRIGITGRDIKISKNHTSYQTAAEWAKDILIGELMLLTTKESANGSTR